LIPGRIARWAWDLERFGLTPAKLAARARSRRHPRPPAILCVSLPKAGTHLLERALCLHPALYRKVLPTLHDNNIGRWHDLAFLLRSLTPGQVLVSHLHHRPEYRAALVASGVRCLFLVRDPRDLLVSQAHYIAAERGHHLHHLFAGQPTLHDRLRLAISGDVRYGLPSIGRRLDDFAGWLDDSDLVVRYEDLVGGDAAYDRQRSTICKLYEVLGMPQSEEFIGWLQERLRSRVSPTFRRGGTGEWREHFTDDTEALFRRAAGPVIERYGYPLTVGR
jgi:hypothetical protein